MNLRQSACGKRLVALGVACLVGLTLAAEDYRYADVSEAPFKMAPIPEYVFPNRVFNIADYGAKPDGGKATAALAQAIAACAQAGGGRVVVPAGTFLTGPVHLRGQVELHLEAGAKLLFTDDPQDYLPAVMSSWEGLECLNYSPLIYAYGCTNVALTGKGCIEAKMDFWKEQMNEAKTGIQDARRILYTWGSEDYPVEKRDITKAHTAIMRPHLVQFNRCRNVRVEGIEIHDSPFWTVHMFLCDGVVVRGVDSKAHGFNNDGVDLEMTRNVLIEDSSFDQGDDGFVFKAGRNRDAWRIGVATENVLIRNCDVKVAGSLIGVGSELSGGVKNVYVHDCKVGKVARLYYIKTNHRRGGIVDNIILKNVKAGAMLKVAAVETDVLYQWRVFKDYETRITKISNLRIEDVEVESARWGIDLKGDARLPIDGFTARNVKIGRTERCLTHVENAEHVVFENVSGGTVGKVTTPWDRQ